MEVSRAVPGQGDESVSHAARGRMWLDRYLEQKGRTEADLAKLLFERGWTAVAEVRSYLSLGTIFVLACLAI